MNYHFIDPVYPELPPGLFMRQEKAEEELFLGKLGIENFFHHLHLPEHIHTFPDRTGKDKEMRWPRLVTVLMGWSHLVYTFQAIHGELLFPGGQ